MICRKCQQEFPNWVKIDGKKRNLQCRVYCLNCSPFGLHNTRPVLDDLPPALPVMMECTDCGRAYLYNRKKGHHRFRCNSCVVNSRRYTLKLRAIAYLGGECARCRYKKCLRALVFHHKDANEKEFTITQNYYRMWEDIAKELDKCELLCSNCHMEEHDRIQGSISSTVEPSPD